MTRTEKENQKNIFILSKEDKPITREMLRSLYKDAEQVENSAIADERHQKIGSMNFFDHP